MPSAPKETERVSLRSLPELGPRPPRAEVAPKAEPTPKRLSFKDLAAALLGPAASEPLAPAAPVIVPAAPVVREPEPRRIDDRLEMLEPTAFWITVMSLVRRDSTSPVFSVSKNCGLWRRTCEYTA